MKLTIEIPDVPNVDLNEMKRILGAKLYEKGKLSLGQAAELAGMSKISFAEILNDYGVSLINYPVSEIVKDAAAI
jgi:predicted HTH domain antitoxin